MRILLIGAHQDDCEFRCGALASKYVNLGYEVKILSMCNGCGGHHLMSPEETTRRRATESARVSEYLGVTYDVWDIDDCNIVPDLSTRKRLIRYIREFNPDLILCHRTNDYHPDHRASGQLVQDAAYLLTVPHECPEVPAMRFMPVIMHYEDNFTFPPFRADIVIDADNEADLKLHIAHLNESQVYEWLPYNEGEDVPVGESERFEWLKGMNITSETTDEEVMAAPRGYAVRFAKTAARFRRELTERYGIERGGKIRYAEAFEVSEYGSHLTDELKAKLFPF